MAQAEALGDVSRMNMYRIPYVDLGNRDIGCPVEGCEVFFADSQQTGPKYGRTWPKNMLKLPGTGIKVWKSQCGLSKRRKCSVDLLEYNERDALPLTIWTVDYKSSLEARERACKLKFELRAHKKEFFFHGDTLLFPCLRNILMLWKNMTCPELN